MAHSLGPSHLRHEESALLAFALSGERFAIPVESVREVIHMSVLSRPPGLPPTLAGFLNLGGEAVPTVRLDRLFDLPGFEVSLYTPILVVRSPESLALIVEDVDGMVTVSAETQLPLRDGSTFNDCAEAEVVIEGCTLHLLSPERILLSQERRRVEELTRMEQRRLDRLEDQV